MSTTIDETRSYDAPARVSSRRGRRARWGILVAALLLITLVGALANRSTSTEPYDIASSGPTGVRALASVLAQRGIHVQRVATADAAVRAAAGRAVTVVVPEPNFVADTRSLTSLSSGRIILFDPSDEALTVVAPGVRRLSGTDTVAREAGCEWPAAKAAGKALTGGATYTVRDDHTIAKCYSSKEVGGGTLVVSRDLGREVVVAGDARFLTNAELANEGNAALAINLLSAHDTVIWLLPRPGEAVPADEPGRRSLTSFLPHRLIAALWTVALGILLLGFAYGRRLGRVVTENLPVVVRAAETVEGKARLYRAARATDRAAGWLRDAALHDLKTRAGVPAAATAPVVIDAVAARTGRPREDVAATLYGPAPQTDRDLVALADALDRLPAEVRRQ